MRTARRDKQESLAEWMRVDDPYPLTAYDHEAFYISGAPTQGAAWDHDTGLRCICGREVVAVMDWNETRTGWAHVGVGDLFDKTDMLKVIG